MTYMTYKVWQLIHKIGLKKKKKTKKNKKKLDLRSLQEFRLLRENFYPDSSSANIYQLG